MVLVDTSVWIELFRRRRRPSPFEATLDLDDVVTCPPIVQEVLQGFEDEAAFRVAREAMLAFPIVESPMPIELFEEAALLYRQARRSGRTIRSGADCLIAASALRHDLEVFHHDRDFEALATISQLRTRRLTR